MSYLDKQKAMEEVEKKVAVELEKLIKREMERTGLERYEAYTKNKAMVLKLKKQYEEKFMLEHPVLKAIKEKELEERAKKIERHRQEKEAMKAKALKEKAIKEKIKQEKIAEEVRRKIKKEAELKQKKKITHEEWLRKSEKDRLQDELAKKLVEQHEKNMYQKMLQQELEREKQMRNKLVEKSRANKVFSDDLIEKEDEFEFGISGEAWLREEELYLLELVKKNIPVKDIAYLLDRTVQAVRHRLSHLKGDLT